MRVYVRMYIQIYLAQNHYFGNHQKRNLLSFVHAYIYIYIYIYI